MPALRGKELDVTCGRWSCASHILSDSERRRPNQIFSSVTTVRKVTFGCVRFAFPSMLLPMSRASSMEFTLRLRGFFTTDTRKSSAYKLADRILVWSSVRLAVSKRTSLQLFRYAPRRTSTRRSEIAMAVLVWRSACQRNALGGD